MVVSASSGNEAKPFWHSVGPLAWPLKKSIGGATCKTEAAHSASYFTYIHVVNYCQDFTGTARIITT